MSLFIDEMARLEDAPFAIVEDANGADERFPRWSISSCSTTMASGEGLSSTR